MKFRDLVELTQDNTISEEELHETFGLANKIFVGNKIYLTARRERYTNIMNLFLLRKITFPE